MNMEELFKKIINHWLIILIGMLPVLDIVTYFLMDTSIGSILTFFRLLLAGIIFIYSFVKSKNKKQFYIFSGIIFLYMIGHIISCSMIGYINIYEDISNMFRILYMPILLFSFTSILKNKKDFERDVVQGIAIAFVITIISIILSLITDTANYTYGNNLSWGIIGWFYNKNTQSLILVVLAYICGAYSLKSKWFYFVAPIIFLVLYFNATKTAYISLVCFMLFCIFYAIFEHKSGKKAIFSLILFSLTILLFEYSPTNNNMSYYASEQTNKNEEITDGINNGDNTQKPSIPPNNQNPSIPPNNQNPSLSAELSFYDSLYRTYTLGNLIDYFGIEEVVIKYDYVKDSFVLSDARLKKRIAASLIYDDESFVSHLFGFEFTKINNITDKNGIAEINDLENDLTAIFYYCGYIGFALYIGFICYFVIKIINSLFRNYKLILKSEYMIWFVLIGLLLIGSEYTGALLRRPNGNIYLALIISFAYVKFTYKNIKLEKKVSFLMLHLGYGGIESATINTANELCNKYNVEIVSLYNLKNNQENLLDKRVKIIYLSKMEPNRKEFLDAFKRKKILRTFKEGLKSVKILFLKKYLIKKYIYNSTSKIIVSTRYDFTKILSKYKNKNAIAIAQEHHHHNNDKKYLNVLKNKYKNINYLFALTNTLCNDYKQILKKHNNIEILVMPNMLSNTEVKLANLDSKNIISVGRLHVGKKVDELVDIVSKIENYNKFYIVGDGEEYEKIKDKITKLKLKNKIDLVGYKDQSEIEKYYCDSRIFIMASVSEGLPMVLLEAMNHGIPCIAYNIDGTKDIIENNKNGFLIDNRNEVEFINKLNQLLTDDVLCKKFSKNAKKVAENYYPKKISENWSKILDRYI